MNLRKYAQGKPCMIRLPGCIDDANHETTVLCHYRDSSTGMGKKEEDLVSAWGCASCHAVVDGRSACKDGSGIWANHEVAYEFMKAIIRTQRELIKGGVVTW